MHVEYLIRRVQGHGVGVVWGKGNVEQRVLLVGVQHVGADVDGVGVRESESAHRAGVIGPTSYTMKVRMNFINLVLNLDLT